MQLWYRCAKGYAKKNHGQMKPRNCVFGEQVAAAVAAQQQPALGSGRLLLPQRLGHRLADRQSGGAPRRRPGRRRHAGAADVDHRRWDAPERSRSQLARSIAVRQRRRGRRRRRRQP